MDHHEPRRAMRAGCLLVAICLGFVTGCGGDDSGAAATVTTTRSTATIPSSTVAPTTQSVTTPPVTTPPVTTASAATAAIEARIAKAYTDNRTFMTRATTDEMKVTLNTAGLLIIAVHPLPTSKNSIGATSGFLGGASNDALAIASHSSLVAAKVTWKDFPEVKRMYVAVSTEFDLQGGGKSLEVAVGVSVDRANGEKMDLDALKTSVGSNSRQFLCLADAYRIHIVIWNGLADKGCLTVQSKGPTP